MSFAIIISEKGGAERREHFDKSEVVVGRLQGNDLMLQKSNVSKRHARLLFNNGRFIVSDLESTNGTYVNGRKIAKATIVREGDKIYVGDFVLRFEAAPGMALAPESAPSAPGPREATAAELSQLPSVPSPALVGSREASSQFPDMVDEGPRVSIPAAPRLPSNVSAVVHPRGGTQAMPAIGVVTPQAAPAVSSGPSTDAGSQHIQALAQAVVSGRPPGATLSPPSPTPSAPSSPDLNHLLAGPSSLRPSTGQHHARSAAALSHRLALHALIEAVAVRVDLASLMPGAWPVDPTLAQRVGQAIRDAVPPLRRDGEIPESIDTNALMRDAQLELLGLGPLGPLLDDDEVSVVQITSHELISVQRGALAMPVEPAFSSPEALRRVLARLCAQAGQPLDPEEAIVERRLPRAHLIALLPPLVAAPTATLRRRSPEVTTEDPVRVGVLPRVAWNFLLQCTMARQNLLIVAPPEMSTVLLGPLLSALPVDERLAVLQAPDQLLATPPHAVSLSLDGTAPAAALPVVARMGLDRAVLSSPGGGTLVAVLESLASRGVSLLAAIAGTNLRQATSRLAAEMSAARPALSTDVAREWLLSSFDLVIEIGRLRDGRLRVLRIAEPPADGSSALRDVFLAVPDRSNGEPVLGPTGAVPRSVDELRARGFPVDVGVFERGSGR